MNPYTTSLEQPQNVDDLLALCTCVVKKIPPHKIPMDIPDKKHDID